MSVTITAADINKLRQTTGAGMMDCRKALTESNGDFETAIDWLRKQGASGNSQNSIVLVWTGSFFNFPRLAGP